MDKKLLNRIFGVVLLGFFIAHIYCYYIYLNGGKTKFNDINIYYVSLYAIVSSMCIVIQLLSKGVFLTVIAGCCLAVSNSFLLVEFMGKPYLWGYSELSMFISTVIVSFLAAIVFNEIKKSLNDGYNNVD
jgi:hypothetical protein